MVGEIKTSGSKNLRWEKNWDEDENFNGFAGWEIGGSPARRECQWNIL
jgi:hypothetical protein